MIQRERKASDRGEERERERDVVEAIQKERG